MRRLVAAVLAGALIPALIPPAFPSEAGEHQGRIVTRARMLMGTVFRFEAPAGRNPQVTEESLEAALDEVDRLEGILSNWRQDSELSRVNRSAREAAVPLSMDLWEAVGRALHWAEETTGAFDPTVEPLTRRFRGGSPGEPPRTSGPDRPARGNWREVLLDPEARTVRFGAGVEGLDLGGIGKGYALDRAAMLLKGRGLDAFLLDAGGQVLAAGSPPGEEGWLIAVADPAQRERPSLSLRLRDASAATSGNSERAGEILDPATGRSVEGKQSATALAPDATAADALSTALFVMGPSRGTAWARGRRDVLVIFLIPGAGAGAAPILRGTLPEFHGHGGIPLIASEPWASGRILNASLH